MICLSLNKYYDKLSPIFRELSKYLLPVNTHTNWLSWLVNRCTRNPTDNSLIDCIICKLFKTTLSNCWRNLYKCKLTKHLWDATKNQTVIINQAFLDIIERLYFVLLDWFYLGVFIYSHLCYRFYTPILYLGYTST